MKNTIRTFSAFLLLPLISLYGEENNSVIAKTSPNGSKKSPVVETRKTAVEFRVGAFIPSGHLFREIYGKAGAVYQLQASTKVYSNLDFWSNIDGFFKSGHPVGCSGSTKIKMGSGSFGLNGFYPFADHFTVYVGMGPSFGAVWVKNKSVCSHSAASRFIFGGVAKSGLTYCINGFLLDVFFDYHYQRAHFQKHVNLSGIKTGLGIGYKF